MSFQYVQLLVENLEESALVRMQQNIRIIPRLENIVYLSLSKLRVNSGLFCFILVH